MWKAALAIAACCAFAGSASSQTQEPTRDELIRMIRSLQARVETLEKASARAAKRPQERYAATAQPIQPQPSLIAAHERPASANFEGPYVGVLGGYGFSHYPKLRFFDFAASPTNMEGINGGIVAGYNVGSGPLVLGFEGRMKVGSEDSANKAVSPFTDRKLPFIISTGSGSSNVLPSPTPSGCGNEHQRSLPDGLASPSGIL
jgi:hypothetical protein